MYRLAVLLKKTVGELETSLTNSELEHWIAFCGMYGPMGDEANDVYVSAILSALQGGIPVIQTKKGRSVKWNKNMPFDREFWKRPMSPKMLADKAMRIFKNLGMKVKGKDG